ncbi:putative transcription factor interactor and regulator CCHC(Zn) family [Helianthus anomalus]
MAVRLTAGAISAICSGNWQTTDAKPVIQVLDVRQVQVQTVSAEKEKYRVRISDGLFHQQGMLATQLNDLVKNQQIQRGSVVQLNQFVANTIRDRMIIIILNVDVILQSCDIIGDAKPFLSTPGSDPSTLRSPAPMQSNNQPTATMGGPQNFMGFVPRPNLGLSSPNYPPRQEHNAGVQSYAMSHAPTMLSRPPANSYMRPVQPVQPTHNQPPPMYMNRGPTARNEAPPRIIPIAALNPYQGRWTIKARVTAKAELRHYNNAKGDGKVFSFDLLDSDGGEIRTTCFNAVADQFYDQVEVGKVYFISKGNIKPAQKAFNHLKNDHEITLDHMSTIQPCLDDDRSIPQQQYHFRSIAEIENAENNTILDIIGVVYSIKPSVSITRKNNTETLKRSLSLKDMSGRSVELTLWGNFCNKEGQSLQNMCDSGTYPVLAVKSARVGEFNGKNVGTISTSLLCIEPDFPEAHELKTWYESVGKNTPSVPLSHDTIGRTDVRKVISQIKDEKLGTNEKPDWITVSATIAFIKVDNFYYTACPLMLGERKCSKKVVNNGDGKWQCDRCDRAVDECDYRYILQLNIQDQTGFTWATAFQETGEDIMGISAKELYDIKEQDDERFAEIIRSVTYEKYNFKLKVKEESFGDEQRVKSTVSKVEKIKFSSDTSFLLDLIKKEDPKFEIPIGASAPLNSVVTASGIGQQAGLPASSTGQFGNHYQQTSLPASQMGQYGNQYGGSRHGVSCNSCGGVGHSSMNCPSAVNGSSGRFNSMSSAGGNSSNCYKCHQPGHWAKDCPGVNNVSTVYGGGNVAPGRYGSASGQYVGGY